jgi:predicted dehydrogenase
MRSGSLLAWLVGAAVLGASTLATSAAQAAQAAQAAEKLEVAFVGVAHIHTPEFIGILKQRKDDVECKYVWDHDKARAERRAKELHSEVVDDLDKIWSDPAIKAVIICSETNRHKELVLAAAKAHKHVYAEKPLGMGSADAYETAKALDDAGLMFTTGYFMRDDPKNIFLKEQCDKGAFGTITRIRGVNVHNGALGGWFDKEWRWMADPSQSGVGGYGDLGTHSLDLLLWFMNQPVERVTATVSNGTARYPNCDEFGEGILLFKNGTIGTLAAGWDDVSNPVTMEICGTEGHATIMNGKLYFKSKQVKGSDDRKPWTDLPKPLTRPLERFLDILEGKKDVVPSINADDAAYRSAVMEALYKGAKEHTWADVVQPEGKK